ncbi:hypothetical protein C0Q70_12418 [Pomacea canaliculata]|uniref:Uncharacterized protein n=1 Tax=Pomacea canaliculata TaxID=400727 RepID=A0A2T7P1I7_POMCA|nr:hypothetical protein C0Q70_12418 [Pomacea canaliculata]
MCQMIHLLSHADSSVSFTVFPPGLRVLGYLNLVTAASILQNPQPRARGHAAGRVDIVLSPWRAKHAPQWGWRSGLRPR